MVHSAHSFAHTGPSSGSGYLDGGLPALANSPGSLTSRVDDGSWYPDYDGFRMTWNNDPSNTANPTVQALAAHAKAMAAAT